MLGKLFSAHEFSDLEGWTQLTPFYVADNREWAAVDVRKQAKVHWYGKVTHPPPPAKNKKHSTFLTKQK